MAFAAEMISHPVIGAGWLAVQINFHDRGAAFYDDGKSVAFRLHIALKCANTVRKVTEIASGNIAE